MQAGHRLVNLIVGIVMICFYYDAAGIVTGTLSDHGEHEQ